MKKLLSCIVFIIYLLLGQTERALAQGDPFGSGSLNGLAIATGSRDIFDIVVNIVNIVLYFLGGIAVLLGLYAGWLWFTSRGNAEQIKKAKGILVSAAIGLAIIFASYAITNFVVGTLYDNIVGDHTNGDGDGDGDDDDGGGTVCPPPIDGSMVICAYSSPRPVGSYVTISGWNFGDFVNVATSRVSIEGTDAPLVSCGSDLYWKRGVTRGTNIYYRVKVVVPDIAVNGPYEIIVQNSVGGVSRQATRLGFYVSAGSPGLNIACIAPDESGRNTNVVAYGINFGPESGTRNIIMTGWTGSPAAAAPVTMTPTSWSNTEVAFAIPNEALSSDVIISNNEINAGVPDSEFFKVTCENNNGNCASGCCSRNNECRPESICSGTVEISGPRINYITPDNGAENNLITIQGSGFGTTAGDVFFTNTSSGAIPARLPSNINTACSDLWTDTNIIVGVPNFVVGDGAGTYSVTVQPDASSVSSNGVSFVINTTNRPGICLADPVFGSLNREVEITGVGFVDATDNTVKYGGIVGYNTDIDEDTDTATSNVPNLRTGLVGIQLNAGTNLSNPYPFSITEAMAGDPNIVNIDPTTGPAGTYLTINGTNFGDSRGTGNVLFDDISADFSFPLQCSSSVWSSSRILVKIPTGLTDGTTYNVKVVRSDAKESNTKEFTATVGTPKPGLCYMFPDNGPKNSLVNFYGDNFGTAPGQVKFYNGQNATAGTWTNNMALDAPVPNNAETGPVVVTAGGQDSNAFNFRVGSCSNNRDCNTAINEVCCQNTIGNYCATNCSNTRMCTYGWTFRTVPTPTTPLEVIAHWPACDGSCGNSQIGVGFNVLLNLASATLTTNYTITDVTPVGERVATESYGPITINSVTLTENEDASIPARVVLNHAGTLQLNHTYGVTVSQDVLSYENERLASPFYWEFRVGQGICRFTGVDIDPANYTALRPNQSIGYDAAPTADVGICGVQRLTCTDCTYAWTIDTPSIASITSGAASRNMTARSTGNSVPAIITGTDNVQCRITQGTNSASARTSLSINYTNYLQSLLMTAHYPDCANACTTAIVGMRFNSQLSDASVAAIIAGTGNLISIRDVTLDAFVTSGVFVDINQPSGSVVRVEHLPFVSGNRYEVVVSDQIQNIFSNNFAGFSWQFTVGSEECVVTGASVIEPDVTATVGQNIRYLVQSTSNTVSCGNIPVNCSNCTYNWSSQLPAVATISSNTQRAVARGVSTGTSEIRCSVRDEGGRNIPVTPGQLTITGPTYLAPYIEDYSPRPPGVTAQCRNTAIELTFSEKMNLDSVRNNLKLFNILTDGTRVPITGSYSFATVDGPDADSTNNETKVVFSPTELLVSNSNYIITLGTGTPPTGMVSLHDVALDLTATPELNNWTFSTGDEICKISYVRTNPSEDWFICGGNTCEGDDALTINGNQHNYFATAYSRQATILSGTGINYTWSVPNDEVVSLSRAVDNQVTATAGDNGRVNVSVQARGNISGVDLGTASASLPVTVFLCQNPWPSLSSFPWVENILNFSTYYCQQFTEGSPTLPYLNAPFPSTHDSSILGEYIFTVNINSVTSQNNSLGSLAYFLPSSQKEKTNVWQRISALMPINQAQAQQDSEIQLPTVYPPTSVTAVVDGNSVTIHWSLPRNLTGIASYEVQRRLNGTSAWSTLRSFPVSGAPTSYVDTPVSDGRYDYRIISVDSNPAGSPASSAIQIVVVSASAVSETNFIIFRVMPNVGHLSVQEWYKEKFPGDAVGTMTTVDGYEAMKVGNTIYISAANISGGIIYTNIYIIAYSIGANAQTKNIYDQLVANFQLNTNNGFSTNNDDNLCYKLDSTTDGRTCSSDLDCQILETCHSKSLKLRRDVKRLTDLLPIKKYLEQYGGVHKACSSNAQISCTENAQCGLLGPCVPYYPQLNAGTFVRGQSNSKWPSWQQTLATDLKQSLPVDPINKFSICPLEGADPATCWNEATREFQCNNDSYVYGYRLEDLGKGYQLYSNFEYDPVSSGFGTFSSGLYPEGLAGIVDVNTTLDGYCTGSPTLPGSNTCGNGRVEPATEECDGGFNNNQCDLVIENRNWWNEQVTGCNPPGTPNECHWYTPTLTREICGGYCGDNILEKDYENCDIVNSVVRNNGFFHCPRATVPVSYTLVTTCNLSCNAVCLDNLPAAKCGDGVWTSGREACDATGSPNGLSGWDCPNNGNISCVPPGTSSGCGMLCDNGATPYQGICGDGIMQSPEECDYADYDTPLPLVADGTHRYTCSSSCTFTNQPYCGDGIIQPTYREQCDTTLLATVLPPQSSEFNQYQCRMVNDADLVLHPRYTRCTPTIGGYCGDNTRQTAYGEFCDGTDYPDRPTPEESSATNTYICADSCLASDPQGGYCGDSTVQAAYEDCDLGASPAQKNVELVFVFDVSRSLDPAATALCGALNQVFTSPLAGVNYKITVFSMADDINTTTNQGFLSSTTNDDLRTLADQTCTSNSSDSTRLSACEHRRVFDALVANCPAYSNFNNPTVYNDLSLSSLRYLSFYDNGSNNITGGVISATTGGNDNGTSLNYCTDDINVSPGGRLENWGYAIKRINESYNWLTGYQRIVIPVSDEYAWCGGATAAVGGAYDPPKNNEDFSAELGANINDVLRAAVNSAHAARPNIHISPVILRNGGYPGDATTDAWGRQNQILGRAIANDTGGIAVTTYDNWNATLILVINSAFCDGNGDGTMDCSLPNNNVTNSDVQAPTQPNSIVPTPSGTQIVLSWVASTDNIGVSQYLIERSLSASSGLDQIATSVTNSYTNTSLNSNTTYYYRIRSQDIAGNYSSYSNVVSTTTTTISDTQPPSIPTNLLAAPSGTQASLSWTASTDNSGVVTGYNVLRSTTNGSGYQVVATSNTNSYTNIGLTAGTTYYYVVQAYDASGNTSNNSNQAVAAIASAPLVGSGPSVSGLSATTLVGGQSYTISGSEFGVKNPVSPLTSLNSVIEQSTPGSSFSAPNWAQVSVSNSNAQYTNADSHSGSKSILFNFSQGSWSQIRFDSGAGHDQFYVTTWVRLIKNDSCSPFQWKNWRLSSSPGYSTNDEVTTTEIIGDHWWSSDRWGNNGVQAYYNGGTMGGSPYSVASDAFPFNQWQRLEQYYKRSSLPSTADGLTWIKRIGRSGYLAYANSFITHDADDGEWRYLRMGQYYGNLPSGCVANFQIYYDDIYVDNTQARIEICNNQNKDLATQCEIQIPHTTWNDGQIQFNANQGSFSTGQSAYLYVIDANGNVNSSGYQLDFSVSETQSLVDKLYSGLVDKLYTWYHEFVNFISKYW
ncbi:MAG: fibronectin type III domain-containing protein [Patescibacteria group bacterium]|jgi:fibronectin type 3 domain-containing protein